MLLLHASYNHMFITSLIRNHNKCNRIKNNKKFQIIVLCFNNNYRLYLLNCRQNYNKYSVHILSSRGGLIWEGGLDEELRRLSMLVIQTSLIYEFMTIILNRYSAFT
jgi:hypothetical protein